MPMTVTRRFFRYFALALATVQIVAFTGAPAIEAALARADNALVVDRNAPQQNAPAHDPSTCVVCQIITSIAVPAQPEAIPAPASVIRVRASVPVDAPRQVFRRDGVLSRAPPTLPA